MHGCMGTGKPLLSILMAVYEPRMDWLRDQLKSLEAQDYPNLQLYIRDDCSPTVPFDEINVLVKECIHSFPYKLQRNDRNLGSNLTFERLTQEAEGEYFAYCDQDDIWLPEKLTVLQGAIEKSGAQLVCSDMYIIDKNGKQVVDSITKIRRHHVFRSGDDLTDTLWYSNFASGCALLVKSSVAKEAIPFNPYMYYDHYITLYAANTGYVSSLDRPLIHHREHGGNQSSTMQGVVDRESYGRIRVDTVVEAVRWLVDYFPADGRLRDTLNKGLTWMDARQKYFYGDRRQVKTIWKYRRFAPMASLFEIMIPYLPKCMFQLAVWASIHNYI